MSEAAEFRRARFRPQTGRLRGQELPVHFNPASLQYTVTNTLKEEGRGNAKKQYVSQSTGKLTMDLVFDTTHSGEDVRLYTEKMAQLMEPVPETGRRLKEVPAVVQFEWGTYTFTGMVESYKETLDFFAPNGVPLRATVNLTLARQDQVFESGPHASVDTQGALQPEPIAVPTRPAEDTTRLGTQGGNARAGRAIAAANGEESMRFPRAPSLTVSAAVELRGPAAFAGAGAAGGVFAGLRTPAGGVGARLDLDRLQGGLSVSPPADAGSRFQLGGQVSAGAATSLQADVGAGVSLRARLRFEEP